MNKKLISSFLVGLFAIVTAGTITSCKDYDDDIADLRNEITATATDLKSLVEEKSSNVEKEIAALNSQSAALEKAYKDADAALQTAIENATNDAKGYADIQAAEAQKAAIAAAKALVDDAVAKLTAGLDAANAKISEQGETITSLLAADVALQDAITAAQARADQAYTLAEQVKKQAEENKEELGKIAENLKTINETLQNQINVLGEKLDEVKSQAEKNAAKIIEQEAALAELKASNKEALDKLAANDNVLENLIMANQELIADLETKVQEAKAAAEKALTDAKTYTNEEIQKIKDLLESYGTLEGVQTKLDALEAAYKAADKALDEKISSLKKQVNAINEQIYELNLAISAVNAKLATLMNDNVNNLITSIISQDQYSYNVYAKVSSARYGTDANFVERDGKKYAYFPYEKAKGYTELTVGTYNVQEWAGYIYATVNPTDIDASKADIQLENSLGKANDYYTLGKAEPAKGHLITTRAASENGLWKLPVKSVTTREKDPSANQDKAAYALYTTYEQDTLDADGEIKKVTKKVYSHYAIALNPKEAYRVYDYHLKMTGAGETCTKENPRIEYNDLFGDIALGTSDKRVYKKYVECVDVEYNGASKGAAAIKKFNEANSTVLQTVLAAENEGKNDTISLVCPEEFTNYEITLKYYVWNYDGSINTMTAKVIFNKVLWDDAETRFNVTPDNGTAVKAFSKEFPEFAFIKGVKSVNNTTWPEEAYSVKATAVTETEKGEVGITGATINFMASQKATTALETVIVDEPQKKLTADLSKIKEMQVVVDPANLKPEKEYKVVLSFYNNVGALVNNVIIYYTLEIPTGKPEPWHIPAAFDPSDKLTIAWADYDVNDKDHAKYKFSGSFFNVNSGFDAFKTVHPYWFELAKADDYALPAGKNAKFAPNAIPAHNNYLMVVPNAALNGKVDEEHVYEMKAGIEFFSLPNLISSHTEKGWADDFSIKFLSPIRYSILGTKGHIDGKTYAGMTNKPITVEYRKSVKIVDDMFSAIDPKEAATVPVHFFGKNIDPRIVDIQIDFAGTHGNNALFMKPDGSKGIYKDADNNWILETSDMVVVNGDTPVKFTMTVKDVWGAVTAYDFTVTVKANH